jgi:hypothetical protein
VGNSRLANIEYCIDNLNKIKYAKANNGNEKILFIICCIYDELTEDIKNTFDKFEKLKKDLLDIKVIYRWNTGGTIKTMDNTLNYVTENNITSNYFGIFEDDSMYNLDDHFIFDTVDKHFDNGIDIVGCQVSEGRQDIIYINGYKCIKKNPPNNHLVPWIKKKHLYFNNNSDEFVDDNIIKWIDGALYITTIEKLKNIKKKLVELTLAPENEKYTHCEHGINYGEVGFPTRLSINGFKFFGISHDMPHYLKNKNIYFQYLNMTSAGIKFH